MYNPFTQCLFKSRDIKWADWTRLDPKRDLSIYMTDKEAVNIPIGFPEDDDAHDDKYFFSEKTVELPAAPMKVVNHGRNIIYDTDVVNAAQQNLNLPDNMAVIPPDDDNSTPSQDEPEGLSAGRNDPVDFQADHAETPSRVTRKKAKETGTTVDISGIDWTKDPA
jgi:hypothetical protein